MSLPSIQEYLPELFKMAEEEEQKPLLTPEVLRAGLKGAIVTGLGTGIGYGTGKLLGYGADAASRKLTGQSIPPHYFPVALGLLGTVAGAAEAARMSNYKELLRHAYEQQHNRTRNPRTGK